MATAAVLYKTFLDRLEQPDISRLGGMPPFLAKYKITFDGYSVNEITAEVGKVAKFPRLYLHPMAIKYGSKLFVLERRWRTKAKENLWLCCYYENCQRFNLGWNHGILDTPEKRDEKLFELFSKFLRDNRIIRQNSTMNVVRAG